MGLEHKNSYIIHDKELFPNFYMLRVKFTLKWLCKKDNNYKNANSEINEINNYCIANSYLINEIFIEMIFLKY